MKRFQIVNLAVFFASVMVLCSCGKDNDSPVVTKTRVIAHRGYWDTDGSAQNSIRALEKAAEIKAYGSEFDVHLTSDDVAVVFHDNKIGGLEIQKTPYAQLKDKTLTNGEKLPTLQQYLEKAQQLKDIKLIFELKSHYNAQRDIEAAQASVAMVKKMNLQDRTEYISFSLTAVKEIHRLAPEADVYYLNGDISPKGLKSYGLSGLDYHFGVMQKHPEWFQEAKDLDLKVNVWTVNDVAIMKDMIKMGADFLTTDNPVLALHVADSVVVTQNVLHLQY